eukprot:g29726.t1
MRCTSLCVHVNACLNLSSTITSSSTSASALPLPNCVSRENEGHGAGTLGKTLPRARLLRVFGTLPGNPQAPSSVMAWEVSFRHCSNENYEKRFGIKIDKKPHDPSSTQELTWWKIPYEYSGPIKAGETANRRSL